MLDPVLVIASSTALAALLASAASHKLRDRRAFNAIVRAYQLLPAPLAPGATASLALIELALAWPCCCPPGAPMQHWGGAVDGAVRQRHRPEPLAWPA
jgi:hypothetical protein